MKEIANINYLGIMVGAFGVFGFAVGKAMHEPQVTLNGAILILLGILVPAFNHYINNKKD